MKNKCIFCGRPELRQTAVPMPVITEGGVPMCEYHLKMFRDWADEKEWEKMREIYKEYKKGTGYGQD